MSVSSFNTVNCQLICLTGASGNKQNQGYLYEFAKKQKVLEINPRSPLIEGLLRRVEDLLDEEEKDLEAEDELKEVASILIDGALVRSGFEVPDSNECVYINHSIRSCTELNFLLDFSRVLIEF